MRFGRRKLITKSKNLVATWICAGDRESAPRQTKMDDRRMDTKKYTFNCKMENDMINCLKSVSKLHFIFIVFSIFFKYDFFLSNLLLSVSDAYINKSVSLKLIKIANHFFLIYVTSLKK